MHRRALGVRRHVVLNAALAEEVGAARAHGLLGVLEAEAADDARAAAVHGFARVLERLVALGALRVQHKVRVVRRLPQPRQQVEDVRVVVKQRASLHVGAKLRDRLRVDGLVEVLLAVVEEVGFERHQLGREHHLVGAPRLGAPQQRLAQHLTLEQQEAVAPGAHVPELADGVDDVAVEEREVLQRRVAAKEAVAVLGVEPILTALAVAAVDLAKVVRVGIEPQELDERVELSDAVLQRRAREAPAE
eukprot:6171890-Pleurochrysis_carterae.AAC.2